MKKERILIIGGTRFIGRNLIEMLSSDQRYEIVMFNRNITGKNLFKDIERIVGDRETADINQISKFSWDYIIDISCYYPLSLSETLNSIKGSIKKYIFISTCSVYEGDKEKSIDRNEEAPLLSCTPEQATDREPESYGNRKAKCEMILRLSGINYTILRPALVFGPNDYTHRLYYWLYHVKNKNKLLVPNFGESLFSVTYVKDLVQTIIKSMNPDISNQAYNVTTKSKFSIKELISLASESMNIKPDITNANSEFLEKENIKQWMDMPLWIDNDYFTYSNQKIVNDYNFKFVKISEAISETINFYKSINWPQPKYGLSEKRKDQLLNLLNKT